MQLETFLKVMESRSFAGAARLLGVSQPAVSQTIARLEEILGGDVFERRRGSPVALTPIGRAILPAARTLLHTVDHQMGRAISVAQSVTGTLSVGFYPGIASGPLHDGISEFVSMHPDVQIRLTEASPRELHRQLNDRAIDIIFVALLPDLKSRVLQQERLWDEELVVVIHENHPLASRPSLNWDDVSSLPLILRSNNGDLSSYLALLSRTGDRDLNCDLHDVSRGALIEMVRIGFGATIQFRCATTWVAGIRLMPIADKSAFASVEAVWPKADRNPLRHSLLNSARRFVRARITTP